MPTFQRISIDQAKQWLDSQPCHLLDIRDPQSFQLSHIGGARHLDNSNVDSFLAEADKTLPVLVYCYHGNSSQGAAQYFSEQAFAEVYSVDGGFEAWRQSYPVEG